MKIRVGILVLQGAFAEHEYSLQQCLQFLPQKDLQLEVVKVRRPEDLQVGL